MNRGRKDAFFYAAISVLTVFWLLACSVIWCIRQIFILLDYLGGVNLKVREYASALIALFLAGGLIYQGYTSEDVEKNRQEVQNEYTVTKQYVKDLKEDYVEIRDECREDGEWIDSTKCNAVKEIDPEAQEVWDKLVALDERMKQANDEAKSLRDTMSTIETIKEKAVPIAAKINDLR